MKTKVFYIVSGVIELFKYLVLVLMISTIFNYQFYLNGIIAFWFTCPFLLVPALLFFQMENRDKKISLFLLFLKVMSVVTGILFFRELMAKENLSLMAGLAVFILTDLLFIIITFFSTLKRT